MTDPTVFRLVRRRAKPGCAPAYEALIRAMFDDARRFPGYPAANLIPPEQAGGELIMPRLTRWLGGWLRR
jgi:hypothetical protein